MLQATVPLEPCFPHNEEIGEEFEIEQKEDWFPEDIVGPGGYFGLDEEDSEDEDEELEVKHQDNDFFEGDDLQERMFQYAAAMDEDIHDEDWVPESLKRRHKRRKTAPKGQFRFSII
ncbi:hypothetical protein D9757_009669 [Collybiopsis confluens]|uniref:Uncharacterized protein n=1 Tax=Collybiopsis confluens TaxID=2823264 RepID=A0A8H5H215_9AGAR|nr:hypothetical protein D9757_009669 [Collybiopsis confluens]